MQHLFRRFWRKQFPREHVTRLTVRMGEGYVEILLPCSRADVQVHEVSGAMEIGLTDLKSNNTVGVSDYASRG